jgi:pyrroline-5-carboxylate reductase
MSQSKIIGIIGFGNMGSAIYNSIKNKYKLYVYDPFKRNDEKNIPFARSIIEIESQCNLVILCVKPDQIRDSISSFSRSNNFVSIAAGITLGQMKEKAPAHSKLIRLMPNLPLLVEEGAMGYIGDKELYPEIVEVFGQLGRLVEIKKESLMDAVTGLSGSGPAFVFSFIHALAEGGVKAGLSFEDALTLAIQTVKGSALYLEKELERSMDVHPASLRNKVTSPGGTTIYGLEKLEEGKFHHSVMNAVFAAFERGRDLEKK